MHRSCRKLNEDSRVYVLLTIRTTHVLEVATIDVPSWVINIDSTMFALCGDSRRKFRLLVYRQSGANLWIVAPATCTVTSKLLFSDPGCGWRTTVYTAIYSYS